MILENTMHTFFKIVFSKLFSNYIYIWVLTLGNLGPLGFTSSLLTMKDYVTLVPSD